MKRCYPWTMTGGARSVALLMVVAIVSLLWWACGGGSSDQVSCAPLEDGLRSYRFSSTVRLVTEGDEDASDADASPGVDVTTKVSGEVQRPDRAKAVTSYSESLGSQNLSVVVIGGTRWTLLGGGWSRTSISDGDPPPIQFLPSTLCRAIVPDIDITGVHASPGRAADIDTLRYHFDNLTSGFISRLPEREGGDDAVYVKTLVVDIWLTKERWPARMEVKGTGAYPDGRSIAADFLTEVTDPNDEDIQIEAPDTSGE